MKMTLLGTGTSHGIPVIGCSCRVCASPYQKDKRLRCSAYIEQHGGSAESGFTAKTDTSMNRAPLSPAAHGAFASRHATDEVSASTAITSLLIDVGPEFRLQALRYGIRQLNAVLLTHSHADHLHGLDDLRIFSYVKLGGKREAAAVSCNSLSVEETAGAGLPLYCNENTLRDVQSRFSYVFAPPKLGGGMPKLQLIDTSAYSREQPLAVGSLRVLPVPMLHGVLPTNGYLISCTGSDGETHSIAYLTDCSVIPESSIALIRAAAGTLDHAVIDGLRRTPHSTHCSFDEALSYAAQLEPRHTWLTHINHDLRHREIQRYINSQLPHHAALQRIVASGGSVAPAYDGLVLESGE